ncbi:hypothetical protein [Caldovatus aquaticus]|uniref:Uncharacterized protein n=1 Tax=Caldovatus aquaticus TaxID=2865671 RepID=A0ABS7EYI2_9PROT|nr:hypothetical protein [Caldovatus aquaticus]MBW8268413.1 hypothetical protein [Caldovatus aquaticus]
MIPALQDLAARLTIPGLPDWVGLALLLLLGLLALAYVLMPFSVFGVKGRLDGIEAQLDEIQAEIRALALRLAEPPGRGAGRPGAAGAAVEDDWIDPPPQPASRRDDYVPPRARPPIPPPPHWPDAPPPPRGGPGGARSEPRLDWPGGER